jgi:tetratricopeptide (TPR) repeat protein
MSEQPRPPAPAASAQLVEEMTGQVVQQCRVDTAQAMRTAQAALEIAEQIDDDRSRALALRAIGNACHVSDRYTEALEHYEKASDIFLRLGDRVEAARTLSNEVMPLALLGRPDEALERAGRAREIFLEQGLPARVARLEINCGNLYHRLDRFAEALACYDRALAGLDPAVDPEARAAILSNRAVTLISLNRFQDALDTYQQARDFCAAREMPLLVAQADYNIAYLHFLRGDYTRAIEMLDQARVSFDRLENHYHLALCDLDQSDIYLELNLYQDAERLAGSARAQFQGLGLGYEMAKSLSNEAVASHFSGNPTRALALFEAAREQFAREKNDIWVHIVDLYRALVYLQMGRSYEALRLASELQIYFSSNGVPTKAVYARLLLSQAHFSLEEIAEAETHCRLAREELQRLEAPWLSFHCYFQLGKICLAKGDRAAAHDSYRSALHTLEAMRSRIQFDELKIAFVKDKLQAFESFVLLCLDAAAEREQAGPAAAAAAEQLRLEAFRAIEQAKSRSVANLVTRSAVVAGGESPSGIVARMRELREELNWYYKKINVDEFQPRSAYQANPADFIRTIREREKEMLKLFRQLPPEEKYGAPYQEPPGSLEEIQAVLPPDGQLLEYYLAEGTVLACLLDRRGLRFFPELSLTSRVERLLRLLRFQMSKMSLGGVFDEFRERIQAGILSHLRDLHRELIEPVQPYLTGSQLVVVPHGFLHYLPFHALYDGRQHLFERHAISYAPSGTLFRNCAMRRPQPAGHSVVMEVATRTTPHILKEAQQIESLLPNAQVFSGQEATAERLRTAGASARFLHIASHAVFRQDNPLFSSIQLGDGWMTLMDVYNLRLNCELATLSGCGTGMNLVLAGDELVGLVRGFLFAGAAALLVSLWDIDDAATAVLMGHFYGKLREGWNKSEALQKALAATRQWNPHPFFWAPFILVGKGW